MGPGTCDREGGLIGGDFLLLFSNGKAVLDYLPASGTARPLTATQQDPTDTASGVFGGDVRVLQLDIDFSDANKLSGNAGFKFGDLILSNMSASGLNGLTVRQFDAIVNALLGGGSSGQFTRANITEFDPITADISAAFEGGTPSDFAQQHLVAPTAAVPEPSTVLLLGLGALGLGWSRRLTRRRRRP